MTELQIRFLSKAEITPILDQEIDALDKLAFTDDDIDDDPDFARIKWASPDWMALGYLNGELVTLLGLLRREILVGGKLVWVVGVGGVATHPNWQKRGFASALLQTAEKFMREKMASSFGLLICADERRPFYGRNGWKLSADEMFFTQDGQRRSLKTSVMILPLTEQVWLAGEIDLCGLPW